jgi:hypothetical protein
MRIARHAVRGGGEAVLISPSVRPKINFLVVAWEDVFLFVWRLLVSKGGTPFPWTAFWNQHFSLVLPPGI